MEFLPAIKLVSRVVERRTTLPILTYIRVTSDGKTVTLAATDLDTEVRAIVDVGTKKLDICAPADALEAAARICSPVLAVAKGNLVVGDDPRFTLNTLPAAEFHVVKTEKGGASFKLPAAEFASDLKALRAAISTEETRFYLNGIYFHIHEGALTMAATDGHRLHRIKRPVPEGAASLGGSILPRRAVSVILAAMDAQPEAAFVSATFKGLQAVLTIGDVTITTKLIDGTFPDYTRVIPAKSEGTIALKAADLTPMCSAAMEFGERKQFIEFDFGASEARIKSVERGVATTKLRGKTEGKLPPSIGFNGRYLREILETRPDETFAFGLGDAASPALLTCGDPAFTAVLMPVRL